MSGSTDDRDPRIAKEIAMSIIYSINDGSDGMWRILRDKVPLHDRLSFV